MRGGAPARRDYSRCSAPLLVASSPSLFGDDHELINTRNVVDTLETGGDLDLVGIPDVERIGCQGRVVRVEAGLVRLGCGTREPFLGRNVHKSDRVTDALGSCRGDIDRITDVDVGLLGPAVKQTVKHAIDVLIAAFGVARAVADDVRGVSSTDHRTVVRWPHRPHFVIRRLDVL